MTTQPDPYGALTDLFTTPSTATTVAEPPRASTVTPRIECLIPGHLPVRAAVWLGPCTWALNPDADDAALLRIEDDSTCLSRLSSTPLDPLDTTRPLAETIDQTATRSRRWAIVPPMQWDAVHLATVGFDRITILSGTDQAAVVAAYQVCKTFASLPGAVQLDLGICFAGSDGTTAEATGRRLADTVREQLGFELALRGHLHRIDDAGAQVQSSRCRSHEHGLDGLVSEIHRGLAATFAEPAEPAEPSPVESPVIHEFPVPSDSVPEPALFDVPPPPLVIDEDVESTPVEPVQPMQSEPVRPSSTSDVEGGHLAEHVDGIDPLPISSPTCPEIDLGVDSHGRVHCLCRESDLRQLRVVSRWVLEHHHILTLACPDRLSASPLEPTCHLFTAHPPDLSDLHGSGLRLHLLTRVHVGRESTWFACPLS